MAKAPKTPKYRIFELAKELNQENQSIIDFLKKRKVKVANRFSAVGEEIYNLLKETFSRRPKATTENQGEPKAEIKAETKVENKVETKTEAKPQKPNSKFDSKHARPRYESKPKPARPAEVKAEEIKPAKSPTTPPPNAKMQSDLEKLFLQRKL